MRPDRSVRLVQLQLGAFSNEAGRQKLHGTVVMYILQIGPKSPKWTVSIQHGRNIGPTWGQLRPARPQLRPNLDQSAPTSRSLHPFGSNFGPSWGPCGFKIGGHSRLRNPQSASFHGYFSRFLLLMTLRLKQCSPLCLRLAQLGVKLSPQVPSCGMLEPTWTSMALFRAQLQPNMTSCAQDSATWAQVGPSWASGPSWVQPKPILPTRCDKLPAISNVFWLWGGFVRGHVAHIGLVSGPTSVPDAPRQDQVAHAKSKGAQVSPCWTAVGLTTGPSSAQVTPKLGPSGLLFGPT